MSVDLRVDWCSYEAAKYAVEKWHYSRRMPAGKLVKIGAWEGDVFVGCVLFGRGATYDIGAPYGLKQTECVELVRLAMGDHIAPVSRIGAVALRWLKNESPGLRLVVSYADPDQNHYGGIYQAMNWIYEGMGKGDYVVRLKGKWVHRRNAHSAIGSSKGLERRAYPGKHKYLYPLDRAMRKQIASLAKPYPKRESRGQGVEGDTVGDQPTGAGSIPADRSGVLEQ